MKQYLFLVVTLFNSLLSYTQHSCKTIVSTIEKDLIPEGIAVDKRTGLIYVSSIVHHKIVVLDTNGKHRDFINTGQDGYLEGLGMKIDEQHQWIWALSNAWGKTNTSQLHAFELSTGKLKKHFILRDTAQHGFNDLVLDETGKIYITDTYFGAVYEADPATEKLKLFLKDPLIATPNGIAFGKNHLLYIATYSNGLIGFDTNKKKLFKLTGYKDSAMIYNLDGLVYGNNSLVGVYNADSTNKNNAIVQYVLDPSGTTIIEEKIIDQGNPLFHEPTTLALANRRIYVLANSHLEAFNKNKQSATGIDDQLTPPAIIVYPEP